MAGSSPDSPKLNELDERERRIVELLHQARATDRAPDDLRRRIEAMHPAPRTRVRRRIQYGGALVGAMAALALALILALPAGTPGAPSVSQAAALAFRGPALSAPLPQASAPDVKLETDIEGLYFPNWQHRFGWQATGQRIDRINGRNATTVFYMRSGKQLAYTIVGLPALAAPAAHRTWLNGTELRTLTLDGRLVVTWRRAGHTCVLSANGVSADVLQRLAAWRAPSDPH